jgi:hypothetical protein
MLIHNDVGAGVNLHPFLTSTLMERILLALPLVAIIWEKYTPLLLDRVQTGSRAVLESVVETGMSNLYWDSNSILTARTVTPCYYRFRGKIDQCNIMIRNTKVGDCLKPFYKWEFLLNGTLNNYNCMQFIY